MLKKRTAGQSYPVCNPTIPGTVVAESPRPIPFATSGSLIVILDEAYRDFAEDTSYPDGLDYVRKKKQLIVVRTFSKVYGLAGLRSCFAGGSDWLHVSGERSFPVHRLGSAVAALGDQDHEEIDPSFLKSITLQTG
jgi:histidinol-phosphate aminotransferase